MDQSSKYPDVPPELEGTDDAKNKPQAVAPWTFETMPMGVKIKSKKYRLTHAVAFPYSDQCVTIVNLAHEKINFRYIDLLNDFTLLDGTPCGIVGGK